MNQVKEWYETLSSRDQRIAQAAVPIVVVLIIIFAVINPINNAVSELKSEVTENKSAVIMLQGMAPKNSGGARKNYASLSSLIEQTTRKNGFKFNRIEEKSSGEIQLWFDTISFDAMMGWLENLENDYQVKTSSISVSQTSETGIVRANIRLVAG